MIRWKKTWDQWEGVPVDVMPCSNDEFLPPPPQPHHIAIMDLQNREIERLRRKFGMSRRRFVRTSAAMTIGFWAIDAIKGGRWGNYAAAHNTATLDACDLEWAGRGGLETVMNLPGEFIFDIQSHHVDPEGDWRVTNPAMHAFFAAHLAAGVGPHRRPARHPRRRLDPGRRGRRDRPDGQPLAVPLLQGAVPGLGDDDDGSVVHADLA